MKTFKLLAIVLGLGFAAGVGCGSDSGSSGKNDAAVLPGAGGAVVPDASGAGGAVGTGGVLGPDAAIGTGGVVGADAAIGAGGTSGPDAPLATGGSSGGLDGSAVDSSATHDVAQTCGTGGSVDGGTAVDSLATEAGQPVANICTGLSASACDVTIRTAAVDPTVVAQDVPNTNPPAYSTCSQ